MRCLSNLRQLGQTAMLYSDQHQGWFPHAKGRDGPAYASLQQLVDWAGDLKPMIFVCPDSRDTPAKKDEDGHFTLGESSCSYAWMNSPTSNTAPGERPLASDDTIRNGGNLQGGQARGIHVVYLDMSANWVAADELPRGLVGNQGRSY